jgi:hypothetical protein
MKIKRAVLVLVLGYLALHTSACSDADLRGDHSKQLLQEKYEKHVQLLAEIKQISGVEAELDPASVYLSRSRESGYRQSIELKRQLDLLRRNSIELLLLAEISQPAINGTSDPRYQLAKNYLTELIERIDAINEVYMLGGELPIQTQTTPSVLGSLVDSK